MAFGDVGILDNFNRSNEGPPPSSSWTTIDDGHKVDSNMCRGNGSGSNVSLWNTSYGPDCEAFFTRATTNAPVYYSVYARVDASFNGYEVYAEPGSSKVEIYRLDEGTGTQLGDDISQSFAAGDSIGIQCIGSTIKAFYKTSGGSWTEIGSRTEGTHSSAGKIGIFTWDATDIDNFGGGTISSGASITLDPATLTATPIAIDVVPGAMSIVLDPSTLTASAIPFTVSAPSGGGLTVSLDTA